MGVARVLQDAGGSGGDRRQAARAQDPVRRADPRRTRRMRRRNGVRFHVGSRRAIPIPRAALAAIKAHNLRVCVWEYPYVSVHSPLFVELASRNYLLTTAEGDPYVFSWSTAPELSPFADAHSAAGFRHRRLHAPRRLCLVARCARPALRRRRRRDEERFRRARPRRRGRVQWRLGAPPAQRLSASLQPVRSRRDRKVSARSRRAADRLGPRRVDRAASAIRSSGAASRRAIGKDSPRRFAAAFRGE